MTSPPVFNARVAVSWDGSGVFDGPHDDVTPDTAGEPGVEITAGRDGAQSLAPPMVQSGAFELFNDDGAYSQHRADSPVYQRVLPGRPVRYAAIISGGVADTYDAPTPYDENDFYDARAARTLGDHLIDELAQSTAWGGRRVALSTIGREVVLTASTITLPLMTGVRTDQAVTAILDACGWPSGRRAISVGDTTLSYYWVDGRPAWDALLEVLAAEGPGTFYVDREGTFHWENRNYRTTEPRSSTSQATYRDVSTPGGLYATAFDYNPGYRNIYNRATYATNRRQEQAEGTVWEYGAVLTLPAGESRSVTARPTDPFVGAASLEGTDFQTTPGGAVTVTLSTTAGASTIITVTNTTAASATVAGPGGAATGLRLRARALAIVSQVAVENTIDASESIAKFSPIPGENVPLPLNVAGWPELEPAMAGAVCDAWVARYMEARPTVSVELRPVDAAHARELERMVSDRVTIVEGNTGLDDDAWINQITTRIAGAGGRSVSVTFACELCDTLTGAVWDGATALWDDPGTLWGI